MSKSSFVKKLSIIACFALLATLFPFAAGINAATWTKIRDFAGSSNVLTIPGANYRGDLAVGSIDPLPFFPGPLAPVNMYTYDGSAFTQVGTAGFGDAEVTGLMPTAVYNDELYIGTYQNSATSTGGELYKWGGSGSPTKITASANGWGEGQPNTGVIPLGVYDNELIVCVENESYAAGGGFRVYKFDGSTWTRIVGAGTPYQAGFGDEDNIALLMLTGESVLFGDKMVLVAQNLTDGISVYTYDGSTFAKIGEPGAGTWNADQIIGVASASGVEGKLYLGTLDTTGASGQLWAYDGSNWAQVTTTGIDAGYAGLQPLARGENLYVSAIEHATAGCRIYKRQGSSFTAISDANFGEAGSANGLATITSYSSRLLGFTGNNAGSQIWSTPILPSIDRLVPESGPYGTAVTIEGHDFLNEQGTGKVLFNGKEANEINSWSDTSIEAVVPPKASTGPVQVVTSSGWESNQVDFTVTLSETWYFAEGTTRDNPADGKTEEWICIQNPGDTNANVTLTYMIAGESNQTQNVVVGKKSRTTVSVNTAIGADKDVSTLVESDQLILAERPMYFNYHNKWVGGHDVIGVPVPRDTYYFAEGTTRANPIDGYFEEWLCFQNPGDADATVTVKYLLETGDTQTESYTVPAEKRHTVSVNNEVGQDHDVSAVVTSDQPIVAERPMYFNYHDKWVGGHDVVGAPGPDTEFFFAEGTTRNNAIDGSFEEWISFQNANNQAASVTITYYTDQAGTQTQDVAIGPNSRVTVSALDKLGPNVDTSFKIESTLPILVERPMYFNYQNLWDGGHDVMGCNAPKKSFYFAEGNTLTNFATWIAVMNPGDLDAQITFKYMLGDGTNKEFTALLAPHQRYTRAVFNDLDPNQDVSIVVESNRDIVVERPMYFNYNGWCTGGHDTLGYGI